MARAHIEPLSGIIRVFGDHAKYGDPYQWAATVRWLDRETIEICGAMSAPTASEWRAIAKLMRSQSPPLKRVLLKRIRPDGTEQVHEFTR
jgi:hypothetical protein